MERSGTTRVGLVLAAVALSMAALAVGCGSSSSKSNEGTAAPAATTAATTSAAAGTAAPTPTAGPVGPDSEKEQTVEVSLSEWKITGPSSAAIGPLKAGEIKFDVINAGTTQHEFVLFRTDADPASFPVKDGKIDEESAGSSPGEADDIEPKDVKQATMRLAPGKYVYLCNVPGHYQSGMRGGLIVQ
jgi:uncharacterized cupredoxin-like copper-binding protein